MSLILTQAKNRTGYERGDGVMEKIMLLSLEKSEQNIYDEIMKIVNEGGISIKKKIDEEHGLIEIGDLKIQSGR